MHSLGGLCMLSAQEVEKAINNALFQARKIYRLLLTT